jgi:hypothetical protein
VRPAAGPATVLEPPPPPPRPRLTERPRCKAVYFRVQHDGPNYVERSDAYAVRILESCLHLATSVGGMPDTQCDATAG